MSGKHEPRVLFSRAEVRAVLIDLNEGDEMGDHRLHESAVVEVVLGKVGIETGGESIECDAGTLLTFAPGENRRVRALAPSRVLLLLSPWPGDGHFAAGETTDPARMPAHATEPPLP
jgi:quercetin dioxygenase-like cupin family protein